MSNDPVGTPWLRGSLMQHFTLMRLIYISLAVAGFVWPIAAQILGGLVFFILVFGKPKEQLNDCNKRAPR